MEQASKQASKQAEAMCGCWNDVHKVYC